jgi:antitoxin component YwqK of YwqJK toxin-antitoxin module
MIKALYRILAATLPVVSTIITSSAQEPQPLPFYNSAELIREGIGEHEQGNFKQAISIYSRIPEGDTNYLLSLYEQALSCLMDSSFEQSIALSAKALRAGYDEPRRLLLHIGTAYHAMQDDEAAIRFYDSVAVLYPHDNSPYYEKAVVYYVKEDYDAAAALLQTSLLRNPLHYRSHALLGNIYAIQGRLSESMMALQASLLCTREASVARTSIGLLNNLAQQSREISDFYSKRKPDFSHPVYDEIDEIIHAKLALDKGYELKIGIDDFIIRQLQLLMEKLEYRENDTNFCMQYYVPLLTQLYARDLFEPYVLLLFSDFGISSVDKLAAAKKGKAYVEATRNIVFPYLYTIQKTRELHAVKREQAPRLYHYFPKDDVLVEGLFADEDKNKVAPGFVKVYQGQYLVAEGNYDKNGDKTGSWKYYFPTGKIKRTENLKAGKRHGQRIDYYKNGHVEDIENWTADELLARDHYSYRGLLEYKSRHVFGKTYEFSYFYPDSSLMRVVKRTKDAFEDGSYTILYPSGKLWKQYSYKNNKLQGPYKEYYENGTLSEAFEYVADEVDGVCKNYYADGSLKSVRNYSAGKSNGVFEEYDEQGVLSLSQQYKNNQLEGWTRYYDAGREYGAVNYVKGKAIAARFFDKDGKVLSDTSDKNGLKQLQIYNEAGVLIRTLPFNDAGKVEGTALYYTPWGTLLEERPFRDGKREGVSIVYQKNGWRSHERTYKDDVSEGYYRAYHSNGALASEGWIKDNTAAGTWHQYYPDSTLSRSYYLLDDEFNGPETNYESDGQPDYTNYYDYGMIVGLSQYDTSGKLFHEQLFEKGEGRYCLLGPKRDTIFSVNLVHGWFHGAYHRYGAGRLLEQGNYKDGKKDGVVTRFHPNGHIRYKGNYVAGKRTGTWMFYREDGELETESVYEDGELNGTEKFYAGNQLRYQTEFKEGGKHGTMKIFGEEGKLAAVLYYHQGMLTGYSYESAPGQLRPQVQIAKATGRINTFYADGKPALDFNFVNNCYEGSQKLLYNNGNLAEERVFYKNNFNGSYRRNYPDGAPLITSNFEHDTQTGAEQKYDAQGTLIFSANYTKGQPHGKALLRSKDGSTNMQVLFRYGVVIE